MKNTLTCKSCGVENPFYEATCKNCNSYLRDKIVNIDLWNIIGRLIEDPLNAFRTIIQSQHKNFVIPIILFASIKFSIDAIFFLIFQKKEEIINNNLFLHFLIALSALLIILFLNSILIKSMADKTKAKTRFKDNFAVLTYSLVPHAFALCLIFPIEVVVFGGYVFSTNPSPFNTKPAMAYILAGFEILVILWGIYLSAVGLYCQTRSKLFAIFWGVLFSLIIFLSMFLISNFF